MELSFELPPKHVAQGLASVSSQAHWGFVLLQYSALSHFFCGSKEMIFTWLTRKTELKQPGNRGCVVFLHFRVRNRCLMMMKSLSCQNLWNLS